MEIQTWVMADRGYGSDHPINHNVNVERLPNALRALTAAAISAGILPCYVARDRTRWVPRVQLGATVGFGHRLADLKSPHYIPPAAFMQIAYRDQPITTAVASASPYQAQALRIAQQTADYLIALWQAMPPVPFDVHIHAGARDHPARPLILADKLPAHASDDGWWVSTTALLAHVPNGASIDNPASPWFIGPHDRADQREVVRLCAEHDRDWPELRTLSGM